MPAVDYCGANLRAYCFNFLWVAEGHTILRNALGLYEKLYLLGFLILCFSGICRNKSRATEEGN